MVISIIYILLFFVLAVGACYTDILYGKIYNKFLLLAGMPLLVINAVMTLLGGFSHIGFYLATVAIAVAVSLLMFYLNIWAGGDAKLFAVIALALPYKIVEIDLWGVSLLFFIPIITFLFAYIYIIGDSIIEKIKFKKTIDKGKFAGKIKSIFFRYIRIYFVIVLVVYLCNQLLGKFIEPIFMWPITVMVSFFVVWTLPKAKVFNKPWFFILFVIIAICLEITGQVDIFKIRLLVIWGLVIISSVIRVFTNNFDYQNINAKDIEPNMILSTEMSLVFNGKNKEFDHISDESLKSRLSEEQVLLVKKICDKNKIEEITIVKKVPLAFFIALGAIIVLFGGIWLCI